MLSVSGSPYSIPATRFTAAIRQGRPVHFGTAPETPDASAPVDPNTPADTAKAATAEEPGFIDSIKNWFKELTESGLIQGPWKAVNVMWKFAAWDAMLEKANKDVKARERALVICDIAFASFREAFAPQAQEEAKATTHRLYAGVLRRFPMLVFEPKFPKDLNPVEKAIETSADPQSMQKQVDNLRDAFTEMNALSKDADDRQERLKELLRDTARIFTH